MCSIVETECNAISISTRTSNKKTPLYDPQCKSTFIREEEQFLKKL